MTLYTPKAPTIRFHDLRRCCVKTIESANLAGLQHAFCQSCGATLGFDGDGWEIETRSPDDAACNSLLRSPPQTVIMSHPSR